MVSRIIVGNVNSNIAVSGDKIGRGDSWRWSKSKNYGLGIFDNGIVNRNDRKGYGAPSGSQGYRIRNAVIINPIGSRTAYSIIDLQFIIGRPVSKESELTGIAEVLRGRWIGCLDGYKRQI